MHDKYLITLGQIAGLGSATINRLLNNFGSYENIWRATSAELKSVQASDLLVEKLITAKQQLDPNRVVNDIYEQNVEIISFTDTDYPFLLKQIKQPPLLLYVRGNKLVLNQQPALSIVGTRHYSFYGRKTLEDLFSIWRTNIQLTVSGLAFGIDTIVHEQSIKNQISTVAVVASGLDWPSFQPQGQRWLAENIINNNGCLLSDFPIKSIVQKYNFPQRNRLIAGLTKITIVIEAGEKSGALITANWAADYGREVFALPGDISRRQSQGCNQLIAKGANVLTNADDILSFLNLKIDQPLTKNLNQNLNDVQKIIINCLRSQPLINIDDLSDLINLPSHQLTVELSALELIDLVERDLFGNYHVK